MTKKKDKKVKIKRGDIPLHKAIYPLRRGTIVGAIAWNDRAIIIGSIVKSTSTVEYLADTIEIVTHEYVIRTLNEQEFTISEEDVFVGSDALFNFILDEIKSHNYVEE